MENCSDQCLNTEGNDWNSKNRIEVHSLSVFSVKTHLIHWSRINSCKTFFSKISFMFKWNDRRSFSSSLSNHLKKSVFLRVTTQSVDQQTRAYVCESACVCVCPLEIALKSTNFFLSLSLSIVGMCKSISNVRVKVWEGDRFSLIIVIWQLKFSRPSFNVFWLTFKLGMWFSLLFFFSLHHTTRRTTTLKNTSCMR